MLKVTCAKCGKEFELDEKWKTFAEKYPDRLTCTSCKKGGSKPYQAKQTADAPASTSTYLKKAASTGKKEVSAQLFRQAYDELKAEFSDVLPEVKEYLGGWTSTIVINRSK